MDVLLDKAGRHRLAVEATIDGCSRKAFLKLGKAADREETPILNGNGRGSGRAGSIVRNSRSV